MLPLFQFSGNLAFQLYRRQPLGLHSTDQWRIDEASWIDIEIPTKLARPHRL